MRYIKKYFELLEELNIQGTYLTKSKSEFILDSVRVDDFLKSKGVRPSF